MAFAFFGEIYPETYRLRNRICVDAWYLCNNGQSRGVSLFSTSSNLGAPTSMVLRPSVFHGVSK